MEHVMEKMQQDIHKLTKMVGDIYMLIAGHELDKDSGIMHQVKNHEERIAYLEKYRDKMIYIGIGLAIATGLSAGIGAAGVFKFLTTIIK